MPTKKEDTQMSKSKRRRRANKPAQNGNQLFDQLSREEQRELLKRRDMERLWNDHGAFTRFVGTEGTDGPRRRKK